MCRQGCSNLITKSNPQEHTCSLWRRASRRQCRKNAKPLFYARNITAAASEGVNVENWLFHGIEPDDYLNVSLVHSCNEHWLACRSLSVFTYGVYIRCYFVSQAKAASVPVSQQQGYTPDKWLFEPTYGLPIVRRQLK